MIFLSFTFLRENSKYFLRINFQHNYCNNIFFWTKNFDGHLDLTEGEIFSKYTTFTTLLCQEKNIWQIFLWNQNMQGSLKNIDFYLNSISNSFFFLFFFRVWNYFDVKNLKCCVSMQIYKLQMKWAIEKQDTCLY